MCDVVLDQGLDVWYEGQIVVFVFKLGQMGENVYDVQIVLCVQQCIGGMEVVGIDFGCGDIVVNLCGFDFWVYIVLGVLQF